MKYSSSLIAAVAACSYFANARPTEILEGPEKGIKGIGFEEIKVHPYSTFKYGGNYGEGYGGKFVGKNDGGVGFGGDGFDCGCVGEGIGEKGIGGEGIGEKGIGEKGLDCGCVGEGIGLKGIGGKGLEGGFEKGTGYGFDYGGIEKPGEVFGYGRGHGRGFRGRGEKGDGGCGCKTVEHRPEEREKVFVERKDFKKDDKHRENREEERKAEDRIFEECEECDRKEFDRYKDINSSHRDHELEKAKHAFEMGYGTSFPSDEF